MLWTFSLDVHRNQYSRERDESNARREVSNRFSERVIWREYTATAGRRICRYRRGPMPVIPASFWSDGRREPAALVDGWRMSEALGRLAPDASELLRIAVRGHHIERWTSPRQDYPAGRIGYLKWRKDLAAFHARRLAAIMTAVGYSPEESERVGTLVRKEGLGFDPEVQTLEDVSCLVFLAHGLHDFMAKTDEDKLARILAKTWRKISEVGCRHALALDLPAVRAWPP
jgi:uncharacterized protein DUF4202